MNVFHFLMTSKERKEQRRKTERQTQTCSILEQTRKTTHLGLLICAKSNIYHSSHNKPEAPFPPN